jgi:heterodisulfide reductase subunit C
MNTAINQPSNCPHCGGYHTGTCPKIKSIEYHENGTIKKIEFKDEPPSALEQYQLQDRRFQ